MIIGGMQKLSLCDYPGTPAIVLFLQGCNFNCPFCHNRQLLPLSGGTEQLNPKEVFDYLQKRRETVSAVVVSGGEPTIQTDLNTFLEAIKAMGYSVKLDTNGSKPEDICNLLRHNLIDYIAMDVKAPWQKYDLLAGKKVQHIAIKKSINSIADSGLPHHFRTTHYTPMLSKDDLIEIKSFLPKNSTHIIQPYQNNTQARSA